MTLCWKWPKIFTKIFVNRMKITSSFPSNILEKELFIDMFKDNIYMNAKSDFVQLHYPGTIKEFCLKPLIHGQINLIKFIEHVNLIMYTAKFDTFLFDQLSLIKF